ncbi:hypothetical protein [Desulfocicer niacini]
MINDVTTLNQHKVYQNQESYPPKTKTVDNPEQKPSFSGDTLSLNNQPAETGTYSVNKTSGRVSSNFSDVRQMIVNTFKEQGLSTQIAAGDTSIDLNNMTQAEAQDLIAEDGYWGVEKTSDRIVAMAISLGGNDPEKLAEIKSGIEKGFQMASDALGGSLPNISMDTFDAVMEKLDSWAQKV